jgi:hypothetical protein
VRIVIEKKSEREESENHTHTNRKAINNFIGFWLLFFIAIIIKYHFGWVQRRMREKRRKKKNKPRRGGCGCVTTRPHVYGARAHTDFFDECVRLTLGCGMKLEIN